MDNPTILQYLESQRDQLFNNLNGLTISTLYKQEYQDLKSGRVFVFDNGERKMLKDLKQLSKDTTNDNLISNKIKEFLRLDNDGLIDYFINEIDWKIIPLFDANFKKAKVNKYNKILKMSFKDKCY